MLTTIDADTTQLFAGANLTQDDNCECTACNRTLREGEQVTIYAARKEDAPTFRIERIYCRDCTPEELTTPTLGLNEHLLQSRLTRTLDVQTQSELYTLHEPRSIATSAPNEGTAEAHDAPEEPSSALIRDERSQTPGRTVYHLDNDEGQPLCNCRGETEYTVVSLAEAETCPARRCQNCQIIHQGGQEARPCPHCSNEIKLSAWPQHVRACTGDPTDATEETDPDGDPAITDTDTQRTTSPTTRTSVRALTRSQSPE
ncbi:hypothetical protein [Halalkalicoccus salilacus]|uniref:hypothetical protein n=1 Tax=Halalkalicoccus salilacus TaxID=3117459 RepID=UPI00300E92B7